MINGHEDSEAMRHQSPPMSHQASFEDDRTKGGNVMAKFLTLIAERFTLPETPAHSIYFEECV